MGSKVKKFGGWQPKKNQALLYFSDSWARFFLFLVWVSLGDFLEKSGRGEPMTTNGDFGELRQRFDLESP